MFLVISQPNESSKHLCFGMAPQLIKFININHNMYLSFRQKLRPKIMMNKAKNKSSLQAMRLDKMCIQNIFKKPSP